MGLKSKTRSPPKKAAKKQRVQEKEQSERFIETARMLGADESGGPFEKTFKKIVSTGRRAAKR